MDKNGAEKAASAGQLKLSSRVIEYDVGKFTTKNGTADYLGCGTFGAVRRCSHEDLGVIVVKCFRLTGEKQEHNKVLKDVSREANSLAILHHDNIVQMLGVVRWKLSIGIVMEYVEGGTLSGLLFNEDIPEIPWPVLLRIFEHIASVLDLLHNYGPRTLFCHGDLKTENILLTRDMSAKVADFGSINISKATGATTASWELAPSKQHTQFYAAPELLKDPSCKRTPAMDIYSLAMIMFEMAARRRVYSGAQASYFIICNGIISGFIRPELSWLNDAQTAASRNEVDTQIFQFLYEQMIRCWDKEPTNRASSGELLTLARDLLKKCNGSKMFLERKKLWNQLVTLKSAGKSEDEASQIDICLQEFSYPFYNVRVQSEDQSSSNQIIKPQLNEQLSQITVPKNAKEEEKYAKTIRDCLGEFENDEDFERLMKLSEAVGVRLRAHLPVRMLDEIAPKCIEIAGMMAHKVHYAQACEFIEFSMAMYVNMSQSGEKRVEFCMGAFAACYLMAKSGIKFLEEEYTRRVVFPLMLRVLEELDKIRFADLDDVLLGKTQCWVRCLVIGRKYDDAALALRAAEELIRTLLDARDEDERNGNERFVNKLLEKVHTKVAKYGAKDFFFDVLRGYATKFSYIPGVAERSILIETRLLHMFDDSSSDDPETQQIEAVLRESERGPAQPPQRQRPTFSTYNMPNLSEDMQLAAAIQASLQQEQREKYMKSILEGLETEKTPTEEQRLLNLFEQVETQPEDTTDDRVTTIPTGPRVPVEVDLSSLSEEEQMRRAIEESLLLSQASGLPFELPKAVEVPCHKARDDEKLINFTSGQSDDLDQSQEDPSLVAKQVLDHLVDLVSDPVAKLDFSSNCTQVVPHSSGAFTTP